MKKLLQKTLALALAAVTTIASTIIVASAEEEKNLAKDAKYTIARLVADPESEEEGAGQFLSYLADNECTRLNDGVTNASGGEVSGQSVGLAGTARSHRIKFDLGAEKNVSKIVLYDMWNSWKSADAESGKPAGNRGYELDTITVLTGDDELAMLKVETTNTEEAYPENERFFKVTVTLNEKATTRYLWIDIQSAQPGVYGTSDDTGAYIVSLDEIEIYGEDAGDAPVASESGNSSESASTAAPTETSAVEVNENAVYDLEVSAPANAKAGDKIDAVITVKNIKSENGLMAVAFKLSYDAAKVTPDVVSENAEDCTPYQAFITKSPEYIMAVAGMEIPTTCYENISRNYDGYYEFKYLDSMSYANKKAGTEVDAALKADGDLVLTVPFTVKEDVADGDKLVFEVSEVGGTDAGNADVQPFTIEGNGSKATVVIGDAVATESSETEASATASGSSEASGTDATGSEVSGTDITGSEVSGTDITGSESSSTSGSEVTSTSTEAQQTETKKEETPKTGDAGLVAFFAFASLALAGVVVLKKSRG